MRFFYALTIFTSALLVFFVQPLMTRMVLPLLGGTPAIWNTSLVFYQAVLLLGYGYVHIMTTRLGTRAQVLLHICILLVPIGLLPIALPAGWIPPQDASQAVWLLGMLSSVVGLPFLAISATSPLLQRWFASIYGAHSNAYSLYAASNLGSLIALISYPILVEPTTTLQQQSMFWAVGYGVLVLLIGVCAAVLWRAGKRVDTANSTPGDEAVAPLSMPQRLRWIILAALPSSLMVSVTTFLSTDVAAIPLLWIMPLSLYLLSFIFVFATKVRLSHAWMIRLMPGMIAVLTLALMMRLNTPLILLMPLHLSTFFIIAMVCHGELARTRPHSHSLTEFYLLMSLGGVLGSCFNALIAPLIFTSILEYPLTLIVAALLATQQRTQPRILPGRRWDVLLPLALGVSAAVMRVLLFQTTNTGTVLSTLVLYGIPFMILLTFLHSPHRFGLGILAMVMVSMIPAPSAGQEQFAERSFFGVSRVVVDQAQGVRTLYHGNVIHGMQYLRPEERPTPLMYYTESGPAGQVFTTLAAQPQRRSIGVVGMGAGSLACYRQPKDHWTFYELDPTVARIARDSRYFRFLEACTPDALIVLGDARVSLTDAPDGAYDVLVLDAYSSDAIPVHLMTTEAIQLYTRKLAPQGILLFHTSNIFFDLAPVLGTIAHEQGLVAWMQLDTDIAPPAPAQKNPSQWVIIARDAATLQSAATDARWKPLAPTSDPVWTDAYASVLRALKW